MDHGEVWLASAGDAPVVARLLDQFNREFDTPTPGVDDLTARLHRLLAEGRDADLVALVIGHPAVGLAVVSFRPCLWHDGPTATLDELYVEPGHRSRGLGTELLKAAEQLACSRGGEDLEINVDGDDVDARRFYERHGYRNVDYGRVDPMFLYIRSLSPPAL